MLITRNTVGPARSAKIPIRLARAHGFSLHSGVAVAGAERTRLEHLVRYVVRPAVALERLALTPAGNVRYTLKTPYRGVP